jgi:Uma2 family endonuclease
VGWDGVSVARRWISADLFGFPEDRKRREIINGELYVSSWPDFWHQVLCANLCFALNNRDEQCIGRAVSFPGLIFSEHDDVVPDVVWVSTKRLAVILRDGKLRAAPELIIEVLAAGSANIARDREAKLDLYSRRKLNEYWIADWRQQRIEVYQASGDYLAPVATFGFGDTLTSALLPGFALPLDRCFQGIPSDAKGDG